MGISEVKRGAEKVHAADSEDEWDAEKVREERRNKGRNCVALR